MPLTPRDATRTLRPRRGWAGMPAIALAVALAAGPGQTVRAGETMPPIPKPAALRLASIDLRTSTLAPPVERPATADKTTWRTTFGSERRSGDPRPRPLTGSLDADVVFVKGVTALRPLRRIFPANDWRLVLSRQLLVSDDPMDPWSRDAVSAVPTTAIAVRYAAGWRIMEQEAIPALGGGLSEPAATAPYVPRAAAVTAARLKIAHGPSIWLAAIDLPPHACAASEPGCDRPQALADWQNTKRQRGEIVVTGGHLTAREPRALPPPPCAGDAIETARPQHTSAPEQTESTHDGTLGCIAAVTLPID